MGGRKSLIWAKCASLHIHNKNLQLNYKICSKFNLIFFFLKQKEQVQPGGTHNERGRIHQELMYCLIYIHTMNFNTYRH